MEYLKTATGSDFSTDSRTIKKDQIFVALKGENFDGHNFVKQAFKKGAKLAIVSRRMPGNIILVKDTLKTYGQIAKWWRDKFDIPVIAITGSMGKTTVKNMVTSILKRKYNVLSAKESFNNQIGLPATILKLNQNHDILVLEMGTNIKGEIRILNRIARPTIAAITNIGPVHLEAFGDLAGIKKEKEAIYKGAKIKIKPSRIKDPDKQNKDTATRIAKALGISNKDIIKGLKNYKKPKMRLERINKKGILFINDAYNSNPISLQYALDQLAKMPGRKIAVLGDMLELGKDSNWFHKNIKIPKNIEILITIGEKAKLIGGRNYKSVKGVANYLKKILKRGDVVLLKGSRKIELEKILEYV